MNNKKLKKQKAKSTKPIRISSLAKKAKSRPHNKSFKLSKINKGVKISPPSSFSLLKQSFSLLKNNWGLFLGLLIVYLLFVLVINGFSFSSDLSEIKNNVDELVSGQAGKVGTTLGLYVYAIASSGSNAASPAGAYQLFLTLIVSLAAIWSARQLMAGKAIRLRDSFYQGMHPLAPFMIIIFVIGLQLIPAMIGSYLLSTVLANGIAATLLEQVLWGLVFILLLLLSIYMLCSSLFALYVSTLPDMTPLKALRSARDLVRYRRISVFLRLFGLGVFMLVLSMAVVIPMIIIASWSVEWVVLLLGGFSLIFFHVYMYMLYRSLL